MPTDKQLAVANAIGRQRLAQIKKLKSQLHHYQEALTPSMMTKRAYTLEVGFDITSTDENGDSGFRHVSVPWTALKSIMEMIKQRAEEEKTDVV